MGRGRKFTKIYTKEECREIAADCKTMTEFRNKSYPAYYQTKLNNWFEEVCPHIKIWIKKPPGSWTKELAKEKAEKYVTRGDFYKNDCEAYAAAYRNGWLDEICSHMIDAGNKSNRLIYAFEFSDNSVYVGLTYNINIRKSQHLSTEASPVFKHINKTNLWPKTVLHTDYIEVEKAVLKEEEVLNKYKNSGWTTLNKIKTGSLGFGYNKNKKKSNKTKSPEERKKAAGKAKKQIARKNINNLKAFHATKEMYIQNISFWKMADFLNDNGYVTRNENKFIASGVSKLYAHVFNYKEILSKRIKKQKAEKLEAARIKKQKAERLKASMGFAPTIDWEVKENCHKEALKYQTKYIFGRKSSQAYKSACKNGWMAEICSHMKNQRKPKGFWKIKENCHETALDFTSIKEFKKAWPHAYRISCEKKWIKEITSHMKKWARQKK